MDEEVALPEGWAVEEETPELPKGWSIEGNTPQSRDYSRMRKAAGPYAAKELDKEEYEALSTRGKEQYFEELERQGEGALSKQFTTKLLSGLTFGASENIDALKPEEYEETSPYTVAGGLGEFIGQTIPLTGLTKVFQGPAVRLAAKSPVLQRQLSSLATMFGVGAAEESLKSVAKGEMPSAEDVIAHGFEWALLDGALQVAGAIGRFAKSLFSKSQATGIPRQQLVNDVYSQIEQAGIDMSQPEKVAQAALEILEAPIEEATLKELSLPQSQKETATELAEQAFSEPPVTPKYLKERKITPQRTDRLKNETITLSEPVQPENLNATHEMQQIENELLDELIESSGERAASEQELGTSIKEDIEANLKAEREQYKPLYEEAEEAAEMIFSPAERTGKVAGDKLIEISRFKTQPEGYPKVVKHLETTLKDLGFTVQKDKPSGRIENILRTRDVSVSDQIDVAKRLNEIIDYQDLEPTVENVLKKVVRELKQDIRTGLAKNPDALTAFELAENAHAKTARKYGTDNIKRIRKEQSGENIAKKIESPTVFQELKEKMSPNEFSKIERELLEKMRSQSHDRSKKTLRELEKHMTENTKKIAKDIVESKNPLNTKAKDKLLKDAVVDDLSNAFNTGTRPDKTLKLWRTEKGRKIVRDAFHGSPNWKEVKNYLEQQSFNDMVNTVTKGGKLDRGKFKEFMRDEAMVKNIQDIGGDEAVSFFKDFDTLTRKVEENAKLLEKVPTKEQIQKAQKFDKEARGQKRLERAVENSNKVEKQTKKLGSDWYKQQKNLGKEKRSAERGSKILKRMVQADFPVQAKAKEWGNWLKETFGLNEKAALTVFGLMKLGIPNTAVSLIGYRIMNKLLTSSSARKAFREAAKYQSDPVKFMLAIEKLGEALEE